MLPLAPSPPHKQLNFKCVVLLSTSSFENKWTLCALSGIVHLSVNVYKLYRKRSTTIYQGQIRILNNLWIHLIHKIFCLKIKIYILFLIPRFMKTWRYTYMETSWETIIAYIIIKLRKVFFLKKILNFFSLQFDPIRKILKFCLQPWKSKQIHCMQLRCPFQDGSNDTLSGFKRLTTKHSLSKKTLLELFNLLGLENLYIYNGRFLTI